MKSLSGLGNRDIFSANLREIMRSRGKDRVTVCDDLGFKYSTFADWYNGNKYPRIDKIEMLAEYFGVKKSDLIEMHDDGMEPFSEPYKAPILGTIPAGYPVCAIEDIEGYASIPYRDKENYFFLRVKGDSMINAGISTDDLVLIRRQPCADDGQIVAARVNGDEATLKRYKRQGGTVFLLPENPKYEPKIVSAKDFDDGNASLIGGAIEVRKKL